MRGEKILRKKYQNRIKGKDRMLALREGWSLEMSRLSRIKILSSEAPQDKTEKSSKETL